MNLIAFVWTYIGILYFLFVFVTIFYFIRTFYDVQSNAGSYKFSNWSKKSLFLAVVNSISGAFIVLEGFLNSSFSSSGSYPCSFSVFFRIILWPLWLHTLQGRIVRVTLQYKSNEAKLEKKNELVQGSTRPVDSDTVSQSTFSTKVFTKLRRMEIFSQEKFIFICIFVIILILLGSTVGLGYSMNFDRSQGYDGCAITKIYIPLYLDMAICIVFLYPVSYYYLWRTSDVYGIGEQLLVGGVCGMVCYILFFIYSFTAGAQSVRFFGGTTFGYLSIAILHTLTVFVPLIKRQKFDELKFSKESFFETLKDRQLLEILKSATMQDFSSENMVFWLKYYDLMRSAYTEILNQLESHGLEKNSTFLNEFQAYSKIKPTDLKNELQLKYSSKFASFLLQNGDFGTIGKFTTSSKESFEVSDSLLLKLIKFRELFLEYGSPFEINLVGNQTTNIVKTLTYIEAKRFNLLVRISPSANSEVIELIKGRTEADLVLSLTIFEKIKDEVLSMLFNNSYVRMLQNNGKNPLRKVESQRSFKKAIVRSVSKGAL